MIREFIIDTNNMPRHCGRCGGGEQKYLETKKIFEPRLLRRRSLVAAG